MMDLCKIIFEIFDFYLNTFCSNSYNQGKMLHDQLAPFLLLRSLLVSEVYILQTAPIYTDHDGDMIQ